MHFSLFFTFLQMLKLAPEAFWGVLFPNFSHSGSGTPEKK
jgi:hypothetical protein